VSDRGDVAGFDGPDGEGGEAALAGDLGGEDEEAALATDLAEAAQGTPAAGEERARLLERARASMIDALTELHAVAGEMLGHLDHRADGPWKAEEAVCYAGDRRREREAQRHYLAAQRWHDTIRRRTI
jgi:hypothetical protein